MPRPDLVLYRDGKPIAIVEAKARRVSEPYRKAVLHQLKTAARYVKTPWSILVDPHQTLIFREDDMDHPLVTLPTRDVLNNSDFSGSRIIGERVLVRAVDQWLRNLQHRHELAPGPPGLQEFLEDLGERFTHREEWQAGDR